jgi:Tol biopolymer transport system component
MPRLAHAVTALAVLGIIAAPGSPAAASAGGVSLVSYTAAGGFAEERSSGPSVSSDGRFVAFESFAENLVANDSNDSLDVFVRDTQTGVTTLVSVASDGTQGNRYSTEASISADGRYVAFTSAATNLVANDVNEDTDVFVHDRQAGTTVLVSVSSAGAQGGWRDGSSEPSISADGRVVAFQTEAKLVANDTNFRWDAYARDLDAGTTSRVSVSSNGVQGNRHLWRGPKISGDGRFVAFESESTNVVFDDNNGVADIFVHDRQTRSTKRVSVNNSGAEGNKASSRPSISADGRYVAFESAATNLTEGDTNNYTDVFVRDIADSFTSRENIRPDGGQAIAGAEEPVISADGTKLAFRSWAPDLVDGPLVWAGTNVYLRDRFAGTNARVSVNAEGKAADQMCLNLGLSADGTAVAWVTDAGNLVPGDTNGRDDVFLHIAR